MTTPRPHLPRLPDTVGWGLALAGGTALISGVSVWLNASGVREVPDAAVYTTLKNGVAAAILVGLLAASTSGRSAVRRLDGRSWRRLAVIGVIGGSIPFLLFFTGLAHATAPGAAFLHKTLFVWVALLAVPFLGERLGWLQVVAIALLLGGQVLLAPPNIEGAAWGTGETLIALATLLWAVEVILAKRLLAAVPPLVVGAGRLGLGLIVLVGWLAVTGGLGTIGALSLTAWGWVLVTGLLLAGYVGTWLAALRRAPASAVSAVLVVGAVVTTLLQALGAGRVPAIGPVAGALVLVAAAVLVALAAGRRASPRPIA
jgi:drug/metabolite transporter (DMT)-like permease